MRIPLFSLLMLATSVSIHASHRLPPSQLDIKIGRTDPTKPHDPHPKSPIEIPEVYQDGTTLTFGSIMPAFTLQLLNVNGEVVYESYVATGTTSVILPDDSTLGSYGTYELRLIYGDIYFYGDITL